MGPALAGLGGAGEERERHGAGAFESGVVEPLAQTCQCRGAGGTAGVRATVVCATGGAWAGDSAGCHGRILSAWGRAECGRVSGVLRVPRGVTRLNVGERSLSGNDHCERVGLVVGGVGDLDFCRVWWANCGCSDLDRVCETHMNGRMERESRHKAIMRAIDRPGGDAYPKPGGAHWSGGGSDPQGSC